MAKQHLYTGTSIYTIIRFDDRQDANRAVEQLKMVMRNRQHDRFYHRVSVASFIRARIVFWTGHDGSRPLTTHDIV